MKKQSKYDSKEESKDAKYSIQSKTKGFEKAGITKTVKSEENYYIEFSNEEMETLGIKPHDKFEVITNDNNSIILKKFEKLDIDLSEFDKDTLAYLIEKSIEDQVPADEVIREVLTSYLRRDVIE